MTDNEPERAPASASEADSWFTPGRFALILGGLIALTFPRVLLGWETFFFRDFGVFGYPLAHFQRECFWHGELPLWNPYNFCGLPFLAQWNTLTLYPPTLFYLIFPLSWSLGVFNLAHLFWAGLGMYFLARHWTGNSLAAAAAGLLFAFNGLTWHSLMWPNDIAGLGWMPWVVLTVEHAWREGGRRIALAALAGAMQMLAGAPEIILLTWALLGVMWLGTFLRREIPAKTLAGRFAAVVMLVGGLAAAQLLPFLDLLRHSHRDAGFGTGMGWAMPLSGLADFFAPLFHLYPAHQGIFVQHDQFWIPSYYLGEGAMILAAIAAVSTWRSTNRRVWLLLAVAVTSVWMALGGHGLLYSLILRAAPALGFMRYPIKFVVLAVFVIPILAAYGVQRLEVSGAARWRAWLIGFAALILGALALLAWLEWKNPGDWGDWMLTDKNILLRGAFVVLLTVLLAGLGRMGMFRQQLGLRLLLLLLLWMDVLTHAPNLTPTVARSVYEPGLIRAEFKLNPRADPGEPRFMETTRDMEKMHYISLTNSVNDFLCRRLALFDDCNLLDGVSKTDGLYSLYIRETMGVLSALYSADEQGVDLRGLKDFIGIAHMSASSPGNSNTLDWVTRDSYLPLVTAGQKPVFALETNILAGLSNAEFNPREVVYLPPEAAAEVQAARTAAKIIAPEIETQRLKFQVDAPAVAMVVVAQSWYRPWHAYVDGRRVVLWPANESFQALEVPAGRHEVKLVYEDRLLEIGAAISLVCLVLIGGIWLGLGRK